MWNFSSSSTSHNHSLYTRQYFIYWTFTLFTHIITIYQMCHTFISLSNYLFLQQESTLHTLH